MRCRWSAGVFLGHERSPRLWEEKGGKKSSFFSTKIRGSGGRGRCAAARLSTRLCQGYKQAVIRPPNGIILPVSAPEHMGPHKAAAAPDRHPLLITQRRGAGPFLLVAFSHFSLSFPSVLQSRKCSLFWSRRLRELTLDQIWTIIETGGRSAVALREKSYILEIIYRVILKKYIKKNII